MFGGTDRIVKVLGKDREVWRDTDLLIEGPAAADAYRAFSDNWKTVTGNELPAIADPPPIDGGVPVQIVQHRPRDDGDHNIQNVMLEHLKACKQGDRAWFDNAYVLPLGGLKPFRLGLIDAAKRGVDVRIVTNGTKTTDLPEINEAALYAYRDLIPAGVRIWERTGRRTIHSKVSTFGGSTTMIGSWNADNRSESLNSEVIAVTYDPTLAKQVEEMIERDCAPHVARELTEDDILAKPLEQELRSLGLAAIGDLL